MRNGQNGVSRQKAFVILAITIANFLILNTRPGGAMAYILPIVSWSFLAAVVLRTIGFSRIKSWFDKRVSIVAAMVATCYIVIIMDIGLLVGFGNSPYSFAPIMITINAILIASTLLGTELSRAALVKSFGRGRPFLAIGLVSIMYTIIGTSVFRLVSFSGPLEFTKFLGVGLLPLLATNILATYLALIGGPMASLAYRAPIMAFWWFCPILPNLSWGIEAFVGVMTPAVAFFVINQFVPLFTLRRAGIPVERRGFVRPKRSSARTWMFVSIACVAMVWASTGLLGVRASTVISGSMSPAMEVGDMAIVYDVAPDSIASGDAIQFWDGQEMVIHRVVDVYDAGGTTLFVTKGDANSTPDPTPVQPSQVVGKVAFVIPKIGWLAIAAKSFIAGVWSFATANAGLLVIALVGGAGTFLVIRINRIRFVGRWTKKKLFNQRLFASLGAVFLLTALSGVAYTHWVETLYINTTLNTGTWEKTENLKTIDDSYVRDDMPDFNFGTFGILEASPGSPVEYVFVKFYLSSLPAGSSISSAKLYLYGYCHHASGASIGVKFVSDDSWEEHTITWNNMPPAVGDMLDSQTVTSPNWYSWGVTSITQQEFGGDKVLSLILYSDNRTAYFSSKEDTTGHPYLEITYV